MVTELTALATELTLTANDDAAGIIFARLKLYERSILEGVVSPIAALTKTGLTMTGFTLFVTAWAVIVAACPPAAVCKGFVAGLVYATVTAFPLTTGLARVSRTFVPEIVTEFTFLAVELTMTEKAETAGTMFARVEL